MPRSDAVSANGAKVLEGNELADEESVDTTVASPEDVLMEWVVRPWLFALGT